jgi:hypothetical protein
VAPQQALALVNSGLTLAQSRSLAAQLSHTAAQSAAGAASTANATGSAGTASSASVAPPVADAGKNAAEAATDRRFIELGFSRILGRSPTAAELDECLRFVEAQTRRLADPKTLTSFTGAADAGLKPATEPRQRARENLVLALFNHNDFLTIR